MKFNVYLMITVAVILYFLFSCTKTNSHRVKIIQTWVDDRGLTSVIFNQDGKIWGLDYLTAHELDSLINIK